MIKYLLTSPKFDGQIVFGYTNGHLVFYNNETTNEAVILWLKQFLPVDEAALQPMQKRIDGTITIVPEDLTFERFWIAYDKKINRKRTEPLFEKLNDAGKMQAIMRIKAYHEYCAFKGRGIADPEKYIRDRYFETNWSKEK